MDGLRFDRWTRRQFGRVAGSVAGLLFATTALEEPAARKRRKKKRKKAPASPPSPPGVTCREQREACGSAVEEPCCGGLVCDDNTCVGDPICVQDGGGPCSDRCDCRLGFECSERAGNTCQVCALPEMPCETHADCCLSTSFCGSNSCHDPQETYCCQGLGAACSAPCQCCPNPGNCGRNGCGGTETVCCRGQGFPCESSCDCCDPLRCLNATCQ
jgi:hypothetical protein